MSGVTPVEIEPLDLSRLEPLIGDARYQWLLEVAEHAKQSLAGVTVWTVNSTAAGGGVSEMIRVLVGYTLGLGLDVRWYTISADTRFFTVTKRLHNQLHGYPGAGKLKPADGKLYKQVTADLGAEMAALVSPGDVVLLHDPQTAGMVAALAAAGAHVVWRCHVGSDAENEWTEAAWSFLQPHLELCQAFVFSRPSYAPDWLAAGLKVIPPSIDPDSTKNEYLSPDQVLVILRRVGLLDGGESAPAVQFVRGDGSLGEVLHEATLVSESAPLGEEVPLVVQVSRWDSLKDMAGVMAGFVGGVGRDSPAHLVLAGPEVSGVSDDPEGAEVLADCRAAWQALEPEDRRRVTLMIVPMADLDENAVIVNALQRHATVVVQKSLAEGFGLTVAEAMWKARPVVASAVGGIVDQVTPGTGILLRDPADLAAFGAALSDLLDDPEELAALGAAARARVLEQFVPDQHLAAYARLMYDLHLQG